MIAITSLTPNFLILNGLDKDLVTVDSVLMLMDMFAMPYKAVVLRLFESGNISHQQAEKLLEIGSADVMERVSLTGKAKRWQLDGKGTESFGTLLEKVEYNRQHEYLTESREKEDVAYFRNALFQLFQHSARSQTATVEIARNLIEVVSDACGLSSQLLNFTNIGNDVVVDSHFFR